jgi:hypothetical protein
MVSPRPETEERQSFPAEENSKEVEADIENGKEAEANESSSGNPQPMESKEESKLVEE